MFLLTGVAHAFCGTYVGSAGAELFNSASELAVVVTDDEVVLTMSNDYAGLAEDFGLLIPVPALLTEEQVQLVDDEVLQADPCSAVVADGIGGAFDAVGCAVEAVHGTLFLVDLGTIDLGFIVNRRYTMRLNPTGANDP